MDFPEQYRAELLKAIDTIDLAKVRAAIQMFAEARDTGHSIFVCGNGGSASSASHFVTDIVKRASYNREKRFRIMSLVDSLPTLTASRDRSVKMFLTFNKSDDANRYRTSLRLWRG
jgi:D-sedoheptulose 7-phosphate isomerase